jgi:hypothetical protein
MLQGVFASSPFFALKPFQRKGNRPLMEVFNEASTTVEVMENFRAQPVAVLMT